MPPPPAFGSSVELVCTAPLMPAGTYHADLNVVGAGYAPAPPDVEYPLTVDASITPAVISRYGGSRVIITGAGFPTWTPLGDEDGVGGDHLHNNTTTVIVTVKIGDVPCDVVKSEPTGIVCVTDAEWEGYDSSSMSSSDGAIPAAKVTVHRVNMDAAPPITASSHPGYVRARASHTPAVDEVVVVGSGEVVGGGGLIPAGEAAVLMARWSVPSPEAASALGSNATVTVTIGRAVQA